MKSKSVLIPVKKIINKINSCQNEEQIENCRQLIYNYVKSAKKNEVVNTRDLWNRLNEELLQRQESLYLVKIFNENI
jgi:hypothetical protein